MTALLILLGLAAVLGLGLVSLLGALRRRAEGEDWAAGANSEGRWR